LRFDTRHLGRVSQIRLIAMQDRYRRGADCVAHPAQRPVVGVNVQQCASEMTAAG
jgi:hypothetical protein